MNKKTMNPDEGGKIRMKRLGKYMSLRNLFLSFKGYREIPFFCSYILFSA